MAKRMCSYRDDPQEESRRDALKHYMDPKKYTSLSHSLLSAEAPITKNVHRGLQLQEKWATAPKHFKNYKHHSRKHMSMHENCTCAIAHMLEELSKETEWSPC